MHPPMDSVRPKAERQLTDEGGEMNLDCIQSTEPPSRLVDARQLAEAEMIALAQQGDNAARPCLPRSVLS
jgi:hypothetical protein